MSGCKRRNILLILCDQLRPDFLHAYGSDFIPTPNIDSLAENGVVFENAITASTVCAPARASALTGQFVSGHDAWTNNIPCKAGTEYLPERMNKSGYMTAAVGCYDHAPVGNPIGYQWVRRFDENRPNCEYLEWLRERHPDAASPFEGEGLHFKYDESEFYDRWSCDRAIEFIESYAGYGCVPDPFFLTGSAPIPETGSPFFLYCGFLSPHSPLLPPKECDGSVDMQSLPKILTNMRDEDVPAVEKYRRAFLNPHSAIADPESVIPERMRERLAYCELIAEIDTLVGRLIKSLKEQNIFEQTTIIFTSDHGSCDNDYNMSTKGPWPYKPQLFVPLIVSNHPGLIPGRCDALCGNLDIGATVLDIAGDKKAFGVSRSLFGIVDGTIPEREVNMSEFCDSCKTLVDKRYTFTYYPFTGETCLFDRINDPEEKNNIGGTPEVADIERKFLMHVIDFLIIAKGVRIEAHDMVPEVREGIEKKHPKFMENYEIAYPVSTMKEIERVREAGLDAHYQDFCLGRQIKAHYGVFFKIRNKGGLGNE